MLNRYFLAAKAEDRRGNSHVRRQSLLRLSGFWPKTAAGTATLGGRVCCGCPVFPHNVFGASLAITPACSRLAGAAGPTGRDAGALWSPWGRMCVRMLREM